MIVIFIGPFNTGYVWKAEEWYDLKYKHRIVPKLIGSLANFPRQESINGLPAILLPEEITLLKENNFAKLIICPPEIYLSVEEIRNSFIQLENSFQKYQENINSEKRIEAIKKNSDSILEGKKRKRKRNEDNTQIVKKKKIAPDKNITNYYSLIFTNDPWIDESLHIQPEWLYPSSQYEKLKYEVFKDLWKKNYYLSDGTKFGGDFLCYMGDPLKFHSSFIIICREIDSVLNCKDLVTYGRIASNAKKIVIIASRNILDVENSLCYQSLKFVNE